MFATTRSSSGRRRTCNSRWRASRKLPGQPRLRVWGWMATRRGPLQLRMTLWACMPRMTYACAKPQPGRFCVQDWLSNLPPRPLDGSTPETASHMVTLLTTVYGAQASASLSRVHRIDMPRSRNPNRAYRCLCLNKAEPYGREKSKQQVADGRSTRLADSVLVSVQA